jgi:hypothetical protein
MKLLVCVHNSFRLSIISFSNPISDPNPAAHSKPSITLEHQHQTFSSNAAIHLKPNFSLCNSELTPRPQLSPKDPQDKHPNNTNNTQATQQRHTFANTKIDKQRSPKQNTPTSERRSQEIIPRKQGRSVLRIRQWDIDEDTLHHDED